MNRKQIENDPRVASLWREQDDCFDSGYSYWADLSIGFIDTESGCHTIHEPTLRLVAQKLKGVKPCDCPECAA